MAQLIHSEMWAKLSWWYFFHAFLLPCRLRDVFTRQVTRQTIINSCLRLFYKIYQSTVTCGKKIVGCLFFCICKCGNANTCSKPQCFFPALYRASKMRLQKLPYSKHSLCLLHIDIWIERQREAVFSYSRRFSVLTSKYHGTLVQ